jgi:hypothetical protein
MENAIYVVNTLNQDKPKRSYIKKGKWGQRHNFKFTNGSSPLPRY